MGDISMGLITLVSVLFLLFFLFVGVYAGRQTKTLDDYYVMQRKAPAYQIAGTIIATNTSTVFFIGYVGSTVEWGPLYMIPTFGMTTFAKLFLAFWIARYIYRMNLLTVPDFFAKRYPSRPVQLITSFIVLISMTFYTISVLLGTNVVMKNILGWPPIVNTLVILGIVTLFTIVGGMRSVVITDTLMFIVFFIGTLIIGSAVIIKLGGIESTFAQAKESIPYVFNWHGKIGKFPALMHIFEVTVTGLVLNMAAPQLLSRINIAKSEREFGKAVVYSGVLQPVLAIWLLFPMGFFPLLNANVEPADAYIWSSLNLVLPIIGAFTLAGLVAAAISTASSLFQQAVSTVSRDLYQRFINPDISDEKLLTVTRISVVIIAIVIFTGTLIPQISAGTVMYSFFFSSAAFAAWLPALLLGILWRNATAHGAFWSMSIALLVAIIVGLGRTTGFTPSWLAPNLVTLIVAILTMVIVSKMTKTTNTEKIVFDSMRDNTIRRGA